MGNYVLHSNFYAINMGIVDIILGYQWMTLVGTINDNIENSF